MSMKDAALIILKADFRDRLKVALTRTAIAVMNETVDEVQTITVTGTPTGGSFSMASLPGSISNRQTGTLTNAATTCIGLNSTVGLFVGMGITGTNIPANCTIAAIVSLTAITLSANASGTGAQTLTFSGTPVTSIPFNATAADVQASLQSLSSIGTGTVVCAGGPLAGTPITVAFTNGLGESPQKLITLGVNSLTGGSVPTATFTRTTAGVSKADAAARKSLAQRVLAKPDDYFNIMALGVSDNATIQSRYPAPSYDLAIDEATIDNDLAFQVSAIWGAYAG